MKLNKKDAALIIKANMSTALHLPKMTDDEDAAQNTILAVTLGVMLANGDKEFMELINRKTKEILEESK